MNDLYALHKRITDLIAAKAKRKEILEALNDLLEVIHRLVFLNFKGGVGKTTFAANFADYLADLVALLMEQEASTQEEAVWGFDLDLQCNYTANFVRPLPTTTLVDFFYEKVSLREVAVQVRKNFWIFPSGLKMNGAAAYVRSQDGGVQRLFQAICELLIAGGLPNPDGKLVLPRYIIFDTAHDSGATTSAILAANELGVPIEYKYFSMMGIFSMIQGITEQMNILNHEIDVKAIIPNQVNERRVNTLRYYRSLRNDEELKDIIYPALHVDVQFDNAQEHKQSIFKYAPRSKGAKEMERIIQTYLGKYSLDDYLADLDREASEEEEAQV
jgi:cellulose biosynthesis protein BcsQ